MKINFLKLKNKILKKSLNIGLDVNTKIVESKYDMKAISIINGEVKLVRADIFNGALNIECADRLYISTFGNDTPSEFIDKLKTLSLEVKGILITFDTYGEKTSIEVELYVDDEQITIHDWMVKKSPCDIQVEYYFYSSLLNILAS